MISCGFMNHDKQISAEGLFPLPICGIMGVLQAEYDAKPIMRLRRSYMEVKFYDSVEDSLLKFAVIISKYQGKWVFCKHKERDTYEIPGGHRETGEDILDTAKRELSEETGALEYSITPICVYSVTGKNRVNQTGEETFGMLFFANINAFSSEIHSEMEYIRCFDDLPSTWTYPLIQPILMREYQKRSQQI